MVRLVAALAALAAVTKAPCGGEVAGRSPVDRGKQGTKRSLVLDAVGIPLGVVSAPANAHDSPLLAPTLDTSANVGPLPEHVQVHLDAGYDSGKTRDELASRGLAGVIAHKGEAAPLQVGGRWPVERTNAWHNHYRKLLICTERRQRVVDFYISFVNSLIMIGRLVREAWPRYRAGTTDHAAPPDLLAQPQSSSSWSTNSVSRVAVRAAPIPATMNQCGVTREPSARGAITVPTSSAMTRTASAGATALVPVYLKNLVTNICDLSEDV